MRRLAGLAGLLVLVSACAVGASRGSLAARSPSPSAEQATAFPTLMPDVSPPASPAQSPSSDATPGASPSTSPGAQVACRGGAGAAMVLVKGWYTEPLMLYDVSDPVHPRLLCKISNTSAHLFTGDTFEYLKPVSAGETDVMLHSLGSGNESVAGKFPFNTSSSAWLTDLSVMAYTVEVASDVQVWLYAQQKAALLFTYQAPQAGCICRFGVPGQVLAVSPDGQYVAAGPGLGFQPLAIYRVSDRTRVAALTGVSSPFWDRVGHRLFLTSTASMWTPEAGVVVLKGATAWPYLAGESPDGSQVAYTAYSDPDAMVQPRLYVYDLKAATTRLLIDKIRTQVLFVKDGWVWYLDEVACDPAVCNVPFGTQPTGNLFAMQLTTGTETPVTFATGENPLTQLGSVDVASFAPGEFWPAT